jgi:hypothetical protein
VNAEASRSLRGRLRKYIGRSGIHGIGIGLRNAKHTVFVYTDEREMPGAIIHEIAEDAEPCEVVVVTEKVPSLK